MTRRDHTLAVPTAEGACKFISAGEMLLRLTPPNHGKIFAADSFQAHYGGSEANISLALANLGIDSAYFTVVPDNPLGKMALRTLRASGVDCSPCILSTPQQTPTHRLGAYYLEAGYGIRASQVTYDRKHSAFAEFDFSQVDIPALLAEYGWLHVSGITPALSPRCAAFILDCLEAAKEEGLIVSFDGNFRSALWSWEEARDFCTKCLPYVDVLLGIEPYHLWKDENDHAQGDVKDGLPLQPSREQQAQVFEAFHARYPNIQYMARHVRYAHSGSENSLQAYLWVDGETYESKRLTFQILDRVGGGDAFASGLIYALIQGWGPQEAVDFAVASSAIKHAIHGDGNLTDDPEAIRSLLDMSFDIKR